MLGKYEEKFSPNRTLQNLNFLTFQARHIKWWYTNSQLLHLKQLASNYLRIPAKLTSFKRCFASAGLTVSELRTQLSGEQLHI